MRLGVVVVAVVTVAAAVALWWWWTSNGHGRTPSTDGSATEPSAPAVVPGEAEASTTAATDRSAPAVVPGEAEASTTAATDASAIAPTTTAAPPPPLPVTGRFVRLEMTRDYESITLDAMVPLWEGTAYNPVNGTVYPLYGNNPTPWLNLGAADNREVWTGKARGGFVEIDLGRTVPVDRIRLATLRNCNDCQRRMALTTLSVRGDNGATVWRMDIVGPGPEYELAVRADTNNTRDVDQR